MELDIDIDIEVNVDMDIDVNAYIDAKERTFKENIIENAIERNPPIQKFEEKEWMAGPRSTVLAV